MCLLILLHGVDPEFPVLVAANRDEARARPFAPPGLWVGEHRRALSPRDRRAGGTWLAVGSGGRLAGITNVAGAPVPEGAPSRGVLPHLALDAPDLEAGAAAVCDAVAAAPHAGFQLLLADPEQAFVLRHVGGAIERLPVTGDHVVLTNEHAPACLTLPGLERALAAGLDARARLEALAPLLLDTGASSGHPVLKTGERHGTVSSSLIAVPATDPRRLVWRFAHGMPGEAPYRDYGNLGRRLAPASDQD